ncbi:ATP-binding protein [Streptomyces sp. NRRL F-525]|uniref:ATP-binding protein n=1 Tax=Streptomyces sp. NRRL F-525 TaxID=1463861 RepID=UPI000525E769|nr:ATP-binding protein [Streptomyces sp. NRRL F-525]
MDERLPEPPSEWRYTLRVPHDPLAPAIARDTVRSVLARHALPELADTAVLLTSELLTNTWRHAPGPASLSLKWADKRLRASVWDTGFLVPYPTGCPEPYAEGGRGLALVELCADAWGSFAMGPAQGKVVWFELMSGVPGRVAA